MKRCSACKHTRPLEEFWKNVSAKDGLQRACKDCIRKSHKKYYENNKRAYFDRRNIYRRKFKKQLDDIKSEKGCLFCKEKDSCCLEFHHVGGSKIEDVGTMKNHAAKQKVLAETEKCVVICANCHRKVHSGKLVVPTP